MKSYQKALLGGVALGGLFLTIHLLGAYLNHIGIESALMSELFAFLRPIRDVLLWPLWFPIDQTSGLYYMIDPEVFDTPKGFAPGGPPNWFRDLMTVVGFVSFFLFYSGVAYLFTVSQKTLFDCWVRLRSLFRSS